VKELWLVDEAGETVEVRTLEADRYGAGKFFDKGEKLVSTILPEFYIDITKIFAD
jgi:Uma2 family endonuclease